ncbi:tyramine oxidase subunit B [Sellimonas catena]|uniref:Ornithine cyclodeaminase n=1 Tax=Sellimonas catena TaxID=2994035 RepID=A0A9W6C980_9FIRM|nr:tyramine oxidase subunit B [Sellimonas catena]GLG06132.1 ornithine cyclodeaminase [Sellimonas catena]
MSGAISFRYLNEDDMIQAGVRDMGKCIESMEEMFALLDRGDYRMGGAHANEHGIKVVFPKVTEIENMPTDEPDKRFMAMPAYLGGKFHMFGIKCYGSNQKNKEKELPRSILMMSLMDVETGAPLAYMSANILSAMRTGAVAGVGFKYLSKKNPKIAGIVGPGTMSRYTLDALMLCQPSIREIKIKGRGKESIDIFLKMCKEKYPQIEKYTICESIQDACEESDIVYFGTTNATKFEDNPYINEKWLKKGALVISASALLVDTDFISDAEKCKVVADNYRMYEDWGEGRELPTQRTVSTLLGMGFYDAVQEGKLKKENITNIAEIICGEKSGRDTDEQIVLYAIGGMPIEDVAWGSECYKVAEEKNIGTSLCLWEQSRL